MTHKVTMSVQNIDTIKTLVKDFNVLAITKDNDEFYIAGVGASGVILVYDNKKNEDGLNIKEISFKSIKELVLE